MKTNHTNLSAQRWKTKLSKNPKITKEKSFRVCLWGRWHFHFSRLLSKNWQEGRKIKTRLCNQLLYRIGTSSMQKSGYECLLCMRGTCSTCFRKWVTVFIRVWSINASIYQGRKVFYLCVCMCECLHQWKNITCLLKYMELFSRDRPRLWYYVSVA